jgi:hypothetical protein
MAGAEARCGGRVVTGENGAYALDDVAAERERQDAKWGQQNHPDGTGWVSVYGGDREAAEDARNHCARAFTAGHGTWRHILEEEVREAFAETDPLLLRTELIQVAAVATAWAEAIDRREAPVARGDEAVRDA